MKNERSKSEQGFSLVEILIVVILLSLFIGAVYESVITGMRVVDNVDERADIRQEITNAFERLSRDATMLRNVDSARTDEFQFDADFDGDDSSSSGAGETNIHYELLSGGIFQRQQASNAAVALVTGVTTLDFDYIEADGTVHTGTVPDSDESELRVVQLSITATRGDETIALATSVYMHNTVPDS